MHLGRNSSAVLLSLISLPSAFSAHEPLNPRLALRQSGSLCNESQQWLPTYEAYTAANTDYYLSQWWSTASSSGERFDDALGQLLGYNNFKCGIGAIASCPVSTCFEAEDAGVQPWTYFAAISIQNLNTMFNFMYTGIALAQTDAQALADDLADNFFHWKNPAYLGAAIAYALDATITTICTFGVASVTSNVVKGGMLGFGAFGGGAAGVVSQYLQPFSGQTRDSGIRKLDVMFYNYSHTARQAMEELADTTFSGKPDSNGHAILEYFRDGSFLDSDLIPQQTQIEGYYKTGLFARAVNALWREKQIYVIGTSANSTALHDYPVGNSWTSPSTGRTYTPYYYHKKKLYPPPGLEFLNGSLYNISASQIAEASGRAWEVAGNDYTPAVATRRLTEALSSDGALTPFQDLAGWEGVFSLPVCDVGNWPQWYVEYGSDILPCCCGTNCKDTHKFVELANLNKTSSWYHHCKRQLKDTDLDFKSIDYGIDLGGKVQQFWHRLGKGGKAGFVIGIAIGCFIAFFIFICICVCIWD